MSPLPGDLIDADGLNRRQVAVGQTPGHGHLHRQEHAVPTRLKRVGHLFPRQSFRPGRQKPGVAFSQWTLATGPGQPFHLDPTLRAVHPSRRINQKDLQAPQRHKLKPAWRPAIVTGPLATTPRTPAATADTGMNVDLKRRDFASLNPSYRAIHERFEFLHPIQDSLELHPVPHSEGLFALPAQQGCLRDAPRSAIQQWVF